MIKPTSVGRSVSHLATRRVAYKVDTCAVQAGGSPEGEVRDRRTQVCSTLHTVHACGLY